MTIKITKYEKGKIVLEDDKNKHNYCSCTDCRLCEEHRVQEEKELWETCMLPTYTGG